MSDSYPELQLFPREDMTARLLEQVAEGKLDLLQLAIDIDLGALGEALATAYSRSQRVPACARGSRGTRAAILTASFATANDGNAMDPERYTHIKDIFARALRVSADQRDGFLSQACACDHGLRSEVEELLEAGTRQVDDAPERARPSGSGSQGASEAPGTVLGAYRLLKPIGEGGMGTVWLAQQDEPVKRQVALKIIKLGMDTREVVIRFEAERQALALMDHAHIAKVFDGGATVSGRPYFVMEHVEGEPITDFCDHQELALGERLALFSKVCEAIQHAHQKGVIHRDIKPGNVLVSFQDGVPVPRVIDFGIAKATNAELTQKTLYTEQAMIIGTPDYMSPEQAKVSGVDVDTRADVYSLGVLLYELLTGTTPFDMRAVLESGYDEVLRTIREVDPVRPSTRVSSLNVTAPSPSATRGVIVGHQEKHLRGELDWIVMKALEKDRDRRYETASALAADVVRYLANEPVEAAPPSTAYRVRKFVRRNRLAVGSAVVVSATLLIATIGLGILYTRSVASEADAGRKAETSRQALEFMTGMFELSNPSQARGETVTVREILDRGAERIEHELSNQPEIRSALMATMGSVYTSLGLYDQAHELLRSAAAESEQLRGADHPETLSLRGALADVLKRRAHFAEAEELLRETIERQARVLGPEHVATLNSRVTLEQILDIQNKFAEAQPLARETLEIARRVLGEEHRLTVTAATQLGLSYLRSARYDEAEQQLTQVLEVRRRTLGDDHPETLTAISHLGELYKDMGRYEESEAIFKEAQETAQRVYGDDHPEFLLYLSNTALLYFAQRRWTDCEDVYRQILEAQRRTLGEDHLDTLTSLNSLGTVLSSQGQLDEAEGHLIGAYEGLSKLLGDEHERTLTTIGNIAQLHLKRGRVDEALDWASKAYESSVTLHGAEHPLTLTRLENLANVYLTLGDVAGTTEILIEVLEGRRLALGNDHPAVTRTLVNLCTSYERLGALEDVRATRVELLERAQAGQAADLTQVADELHELAMDHLREFDYERGSDCIKQILRIRLKVLGAEDAMTLSAMRDRLQVAIKLDRWSSIEPRITEFHEAHLRALGPDDPYTIRLLEILVEGYVHVREAELAETWRDLIP